MFATVVHVLLPLPYPTFFDFTLAVVMVFYCANVIPVQTSHCTDNVFLLGFRRVCVCLKGFRMLSVRLSQSYCVMSEPVLHMGHAVDDILSTE